MKSLFRCRVCQREYGFDAGSGLCTSCMIGAAFGGSDDDDGHDSHHHHHDDDDDDASMEQNGGLERDDLQVDRSAVKEIATRVSRYSRRSLESSGTVIGRSGSRSSRQFAVRLPVNELEYPEVQLAAGNDQADSTAEDSGEQEDSIRSAVESTSRIEIGREFARGAMGIIYRAVDPELGRELAVKVLRPDLASHPELVRRFIEEAQITGQLQHPGVPPVHEIGVLEDGRPYFSMKLLRGETLSVLLKRRRSPLENQTRFLAIFEQICHTMAYAHSRRVIHRDLKPNNVMVGRFDEVLVMDWGLAKVLRDNGAFATDGERTDSLTMYAADSRGDMSQIGKILGTPAYMPPEQARGELSRLNERADVFALGGILCEILTGSSTFVGTDSDVIQSQAAQGDMDEVFQRLRESGADTELIELASKCLASRPLDRFRDAGEVTTRIKAHREGVESRLRISELERVRSMARATEERKRRKQVVRLSAVVVVLSLLAGTMLLMSLRANLIQSSRFESALREIVLLRDRARQEPGEPAHWLVASEAIHGVEHLADTVWGRNGDTRLAGMRAEIRTGLTAARRAQKLMEELDDIRASRADDPRGSVRDSAYAAAFRDAGIDVLAQPPEQVGSSIRSLPGTFPQRVTAVLDDWTNLKLKRGGDPSVVNQMVAAANAADPDPWRQQLRQAIAISDHQLRTQRLIQFTEQVNLEKLPARSLVTLGASLVESKELRRAETILNRGVIQYPSDPWLHLEIANLLMVSKHGELAVGHLFAARAALPRLEHELGHVLAEIGRFEDAERVFKEHVARHPRDVRTLICYANHLEDQNKQAEAEQIYNAALGVLEELIARHSDDDFVQYMLAVAEFHLGNSRQAIPRLQELVKRSPKDALAMQRLGEFLSKEGRSKEAIEVLTKAVSIDPHNVRTRSYLGKAHTMAGQYPQAIEQLQEAIKVRPDLGSLHGNLSVTYERMKKLPEAESACREALRLDPRNWRSHKNLIQLMLQGNRVDEAVATAREMVRALPDHPESYANLGRALLVAEHAEESETACRDSLRLRPDDPSTLFNLGVALQRLSRFSEAAEVFKKAHQLGSQQPNWKLPSARFLKQATEDADAAQRLPKILKGEETPRSSSDRLVLYRACLHKYQFVAAARFASDILNSDPAMRDDLKIPLRGMLAYAALSAATGKGNDALPETSAERRALGAQALAALSDDLAIRQRMWNQMSPLEKQATVDNLHHVRQFGRSLLRQNPGEFEKLSVDEQRSWQAYWKLEEEFLRQVTSKVKAPVTGKGAA